MAAQRDPNRAGDPHGHRADSPAEIPAPGWRQVLIRTWKRTWDDNIGLISAGVAFYGFFAMLPLLWIVVLAYGLFSDPVSVVSNVHALTRVLPRDVAQLIGDQLANAVHTSEAKKGPALIAALAVAVYGGTNGSAALITALNVAYEEKEKRGLLAFYLLAIAMTVGAVAVALLAIGITVLVAALRRLLPHLPEGLVLAGQLLSLAVMALAAAAIAATLYRYAPSREEARWRWITPGSGFAGVAWLLLTLAFGFYVSHFTDYGAAYGSLGASVALLTWIYLSAYTLVLGAELNSEIEHQTAKDSTTGSPLPMGDRGAWAADNVAMDETIQDRPEERREGEKLTQASATVAEPDDE